MGGVVQVKQNQFRQHISNSSLLHLAFPHAAATRLGPRFSALASAGMTRSGQWQLPHDVYFGARLPLCILPISGPIACGCREFAEALAMTFEMP